MFLPVEIITKTKLGEPLTTHELTWFITAYMNNQVSVEQMSAWLMCVRLNGLTDVETALLTKLLKNSGIVFTWPGLHCVDKHSTGGVGDKISLVLAPLVAAGGVPVPMISGRALGHTGGTLDKLESIPGFNVNLSYQEFRKQVKKLKVAIMGQTKDLCPADKRLYALRDITSTVDSIPLICASIMSKKLAEGVKSLILDVKFGSGAFMKKYEDALELARKLKTTGEENGVKVTALLTNMNQPLGAYVGNSLEIKEVLQILEGKAKLYHGQDLYADTRELTLHQAAYMFLSTKKVKTLAEGLKLSQELLESGAALAKFKELVEAQGGNLDLLPEADYTQIVRAKKSGFVQSIDTYAVGMAAIKLGGGRLQSSDTIDYSAGIEFRLKLGTYIKKGDPLCVLYSQNKYKFKEVKNLLRSAIKLGPKAPSAERLIRKVL